MKYLISSILLVTISLRSFAQSSEFKTYSNDLIYSEATMSKLSHIVDSLNLKYKSCDLDKVFNSKSQTIGHSIRYKSDKADEAKKDIDNGISLEDFIAKYPEAKVKKNVLVVKSKYKNYKEENIIEFAEVSPNGDSGLRISKDEDTGIYTKEMKGKWLYNYRTKGQYSSELISAFYFDNSFTSKPIKEKYARMIGYADCLIDTTAVKFNESAKRGYVELPKNWQKLNEKKQDKLLEEMRNTKVIGMCSQDNSPRIHAMNMALLSAETTKWEIFLRSHLDIMNDRFDRMSDGSYAWKNRNTYIRELEELDIAVSDLIFGITIRLENPAKNHYYGSIGRIGRALSETQKREDIEKIMLSMIEDPELDDYNRLLSYFLFINYNHHIVDTKIKEGNIDKLKASVGLLPDYLKNKISFK